MFQMEKNGSSRRYCKVTEEGIAIDTLMDN